ncbi:MAG: hypothetical protein JO358_20375 [Alphaproteobacteria bacterium]|nr:hypothetical protein [Alphaproteobacteria bacterium]
MTFSDPEQLARHPDVDLVTVSVEVPDHYRPVIAAIAARKHVIVSGHSGATLEKRCRCSQRRNSAGIRHTVRSIHHTRARLAGRRFARSADPTTCHDARIARWRVFASRFATPLSLGSAFIQQRVEISEPVGIQTRDS